MSRLFHRTGLMALLRMISNRGRLRRDSTGRLEFPYLTQRRDPAAQILIYHRVNDDHDPYFGGTPTDEFDRQMQYVSSHYHVMPLGDLVAGLRDRTLPENAVAVTFDDGYRDNYLQAFPVLRRYSISATMFLATAAIDTDRTLWHDDVFSAFRETKERGLAPLGPAGIQGSLATVADRLRLQHEFLAHIRTLSDEDRTQAIERLRAALRVGPPRPAPGLMLSWEEVGIMSRAGIQFGSHTETHPILSRLPRGRAEAEIRDSKRRMEERLGIQVEGFAYPNGTRADFDSETKALLEAAGYRYAVTTIAGLNEHGTDRFELRRGTPWDGDVFAFGFRLLYDKLRA